MIRMPANDLLNFCTAYPQYTGILNEKRTCRNIRVDCDFVPNSMISFLYHRHLLVKHFSCNSKRQNSPGMPLNRVLLHMTNLVSLNMQGCRLLFTLDFLKCTPHIQQLNVTNCHSLSTYSLVNNLFRLEKLQVFECENNDLRVSAYSVYQAVCGVSSLTYLNCKNSGVMCPWILRMIFEECSNLRTCYFTTLFSMDTEKHKYDWYHLVRKTHPHVNFPQNVIQKVVEYEGSCARIIAEEKKTNFHALR